MKRRSFFVALAGLIAVWATPALARDAIVIVTMAGEAYSGPPKFKFSADDRVLGTRAVTNAVDTSTGETLRFGDNGKRPAVQKFAFTVPDIDKVSYLEFEFTNDDWAGKGKRGDRNLYVLGLSLSIVEKTQTGLTAQTVQFKPASFEAKTRNAQGSAVTARYAALYHRGLLRLNRPPSGWGSPEAAQTASSTKQQETTVVSGVAKPSPSCAVSSLELKGFSKNSTTLSETMQAQLAPLPAVLRDTSCIAAIRAYTAGGPSDAFRAGLSLARAQEVAKELTRLGLASERIRIESATGRGRRVVISFE